METPYFCEGAKRIFLSMILDLELTLYPKLDAVLFSAQMSLEHW